MWSSFCGLRLKTTGIVVGCIGITISILWTILVVYILVHLKEYGVSNARSMVIAYMCDVMLVLVHLMSAGLLVMGAVKERRRFLLPWLVSTALMLAFFAVSVIPRIFRRIPPCDVVVAAIIYALVFVALLLVWYAIYSLYRQLEVKHKQQKMLSLLWQNQIYAT